MTTQGSEPVQSWIEDSFVGKPAKVIAVSADGLSVHLRLSDGTAARISGSEPIGLALSDVVLLAQDAFEQAPKDVWNEEHSVGIVKKIYDKRALVESNLSLRLIPLTDGVEVAVGNTVAFDSNGVRSVISESPIRIRDFGGDEDDAIEKYRWDTDKDHLSFEDFGGYKDVLNRARDLIETQLDHKSELDAIGAKPIKGVMFTGPPGTGKTLLARIIAKEAKAEFFLVSGPSIVSKWLGDSEEVLRRIFDEAAKSERAVIFFDEIDSLAAQRSEDSHEASKRLVAQLLTLMDGFDRSGNVVVIAATNRIDDVDVALRRPGRFDWEIEFGLPTAQDRLEILEASMRRLQLSGDLPVEDIAVRTEGWSAAGLASLWTEAAQLAARDSRSAICEEDLAEAFELVEARRIQAKSEERHGG